MKATIVWTVLPRGVRPNGDLELSVHLSPRLRPDGASAPLSTFRELQEPGDRDRNWASHAFSFGVEVASAAPTIGRPRSYATVVADRARLDPRLWGRLLAGTEVRAHAPNDLRARKIRSFPVGHVHQFVRDYFVATVAASPTDAPPLPDGEGPLAVLDFSSAERRKKLGADLDARLVEHGYVPAGDPAPALDFFQALAFHGFKGRSSHDAPLEPPKVDFHEAVALLADYPTLLRRLGLVFDLVVPPPPGPFAKIRVHPTVGPRGGAAAPRDDVTPWTAARYTAGATFTAAPALPEQRRGGFLDLRRPTVTVEQVDVDGAALKMIQHAEASARLASRRSLGAPEQGGPPALRSAGLAVSVSDRAGSLRRTIDHQGALHDAVEAGAGAAIVLGAEELTRGLRVDVLDPASGRWCSLHRRVPTLTIKTDHGVDPLDAGVKEEEGVLTTSVTSPTEPTHGDDLYLHETLFHWSGWSLSVARPGKRIDRVGHGIDDSTNPAATALGLAATYAVVAGSLPRLRYGARYRLRARLVDLAGNSLPWSSDDASAATDEVPYLRFEPVPAPVLSREAPPRPGESMDRLVIRSFNHAEALDHTPTDEVTARGVFPPRCAVLTAEQHGALDSTDGVRGDPATYALLAARDRVQPPALTQAPTAADPRPLEAIRYLPDPLAAGVRIAGLPGADAPLEIECALTWPETQPLRVALREGSGPPSWDAATRTLSVALPKGEQARVRVSSRLPGPEALAALGVWRWIEEACPKGWLEIARAWAASGGLWALTPARELELVHAVQQPLARPAFASLQVTRGAGETAAALAATIEVDAKSSARVDVVARWRDREDDGKSPSGDIWRTRAGQVGAPLIDDRRAAAIAVELPHELGDTRYRRVAYDLTATSRFRENFLTEGAGPPLELTRAAIAPVEVDVLSTARPAAPLVEYVIPTFGWERRDAPGGVASRRRGQGLRVYLRRPWFSSGDGELLGVIVAHGPRISYDSIDSSEAGWIKGEAVPELPPALQRCATQWGSDPIWASAATWPTPSLHHLPRRCAQRIGVTLEGLAWPSKSPWTLAVAGHEVAFDDERGLWFSDIELDTGDAYFPFVRLALARFQPRSIAGVEVSRTALADFVQLAPERLAWLAEDPEDPQLVRVSVSGPAPRGGASSPLAAELRVRVEASQGEADDPWLPADDPWTTLSQTQVSATVAVWSGAARLLAPRGQLRQRVVIEEHELLPRALGGMVDASPGRRLVYADAIEL